MLPCGSITYRHNIGMSGKTQMRGRITIAREQIVDPGAALAKWQARTGKPDGGEFRFEKVKRPTLGRGD